MLAGGALHAYRAGRDPERDEQAWYGLMIEAASMCSTINWAEE
jgi:hypothetical protein